MGDGNFMCRCDWQSRSICQRTLYWARKFLGLRPGDALLPNLLLWERHCTEPEWPSLSIVSMAVDMWFGVSAKIGDESVFVQADDLDDAFARILEIYCQRVGVR